MLAVTGVPIDSSRPYRWPSELIELVEAVTRADPSNESTWIEWKSTLDLGDKSGHYHVAKHVLGFANRTVATARTHVGGHAYMIVGAEPGGVEGIEAVDPAVLRSKIIRYVGAAVRWRPELISVQGKQVLMVVVDPPEAGDPIHPVRHQLDKHEKGRILVRRAGSTDPADDFEVDQLVQRVRTGEGGLEITIEPLSTMIERKPSFPDFEELAETERVATLARPRADTPRPGGALGAFLNQAAAMGSTFEEPDERSQEDYEEEVEDYAKAYNQALQQRAAWRVWRHRPIFLRLEAVNLTEANFADIELEIHVPGDVRSWPEALDDFRRAGETPLPDRPAALGTRKRRSLFDIGSVPTGLMRPPVLGDSYRTPTISRGPSFTVKDSGSVTVDFSGIDLRPAQRLKLPPVRLLVDAPEGTMLDCEWKATAGNVPRRLSGRFGLTVGASTVSFDDLEIDRETDADNQEDND